MAENKQKPVLSVRVDQQLIDRIDRLAEEGGVSRTDIVERCLGVGIKDQEEYLAWLNGRVSGPLASMMMQPQVLKVLNALTGGGEVDENQVRIAENVRSRKRAIPRGRTATQ